MARITNEEILEKIKALENGLPNGEIKELCREVKVLKASQEAHTKKQEEQFSETNKHIRSLEKRLYNPDDGVIVKVNSLLNFKSGVTKALWIVFGSVIGDFVQKIDGISYGSYIVPGLLMLTLLTQSISNTSFGIFFQNLMVQFMKF